VLCRHTFIPTGFILKTGWPSILFLNQTFTPKYFWVLGIGMGLGITNFWVLGMGMGSGIRKFLGFGFWVLGMGWVYIPKPKPKTQNFFG